MDTLNDLALLELALGHATDACRAEVGVTRLNATQAAQVLVTWTKMGLLSEKLFKKNNRKATKTNTLLLPLGNQITIGNALGHAPVVQLAL